jgi:pantetheine-phosphate adenylyltransferase
MKTIALYCGSFNPMHTGHLNILHKARDIFGVENVIIAIGVNPSKAKTLSENEINNRLNQLKKVNPKVDYYTGLLTDFVEKYENQGYNVVLIRGLRNGFDLNAENNQLAYIKGFKPNIKIIYIPCDKEFEHISSSDIRNMEKAYPGSMDKYIVS